MNPDRIQSRLALVRRRVLRFRDKQSLWWWLGLAALALLGGVSGCASRPTADLIIGPGYTPSNIYGRGWRSFNVLRRVAYLPLDVKPGGSGQELLVSILPAEVRQAAVFDLVTLTPEEILECASGGRIAANEPLPAALRTNLQTRYSCDGVLVAALTRFDAYPPLAVGWKLTLLDLKSGDTLWAADELFDAHRPAVVNGARRYHRQESQVPAQLSDTRSILLSPAAFGRYSAQAMASALAEKPAS